VGFFSNSGIAFFTRRREYASFVIAQSDKTNPTRTEKKSDVTQPCVGWVQAEIFTRIKKKLEITKRKDPHVAQFDPTRTCCGSGAGHEFDPT
jgi:hypothetical protein